MKLYNMHLFRHHHWKRIRKKAEYLLNLTTDERPDNFKKISAADLKDVIKFIKNDIIKPIDKGLNDCHKIVSHALNISHTQASRVLQEIGNTKSLAKVKSIVLMADKNNYHAKATNREYEAMQKGSEAYCDDFNLKADCKTLITEIEDFIKHHTDEENAEKNSCWILCC